MATANYLSINGYNVSKLVKYDVGYEHLYADNTGRDLNGNMHADLIGIFSKIELTEGSLNTTEMASLLSILDNVFVTVTFFDPKTNGNRTEQMYVNDYTVSRKNLTRYNQFDFNLIGMKKRS